MLNKDFDSDIRGGVKQRTSLIYDERSEDSQGQVEGKAHSGNWMILEMTKGTLKNKFLSASFTFKEEEKNE